MLYDNACIIMLMQFIILPEKHFLISQSHFFYKVVVCSLLVPFFNPYLPNDTILRFPGLLQFQPFFVHFLSFLEEKTRSTKFCTKFYIKAAKLATFYKIFQKTVHVLRVKNITNPSGFTSTIFTSSIKIIIKKIEEFLQTVLRPY